MKPREPLSPELEALLAPHRRVLPLAPVVAARAIARAARAEESQQAVGVTLARPWWAFAAAAGAVVALSAGAYAALSWRTMPPSPAMVRVAPIAPRVTEPLPPPIAVVAFETQAPATTAAPLRRRIVRKTSAATLPTTNAELQLLRSARQDVTRADFAAALATVAEHARRFHHGTLVEEREAIRVKSLAGLGRHEDAQRAAIEFHARFPRSVLLSTFERMTEAER